MDINIDALYNILKKNQEDVNDAMGLKKKTVVVIYDPLALIAEKIKVSKRKEKLVVSLDSEGSDADDFSELEKITAFLLTRNNSLSRRMTNCKKVKVKDYEYYKIKMLLAKKDKDEQVLLAEDQAWMESSSDSDQEINANMVFMAQIEKFLSDSEASSLSVDDKISEVSYYLSESKSESEYETSEYYDNITTYGFFVNDNDDQEIFHDCENFPKNLIESQSIHNESAVDHNDSEGIDKLIRKFNKNIAKCLKRIEKENQQNKDFENQNKDLKDKYNNDDLLAQMNVLKDQLKVKHVVIDTHVECQEIYAKLEAERYEYTIRYSAYFDNDKQHRKQTADQEVLYDKIIVQLVELDKHVRDLKNMILEKDFNISELEECVRNKDLEIEKCLEGLNFCENKFHKMGQTNQTVHMIMSSKDTLYNGRKGIGFENPSYFEKAKDLRPSLYDEKVIGLGYTSMFLTYSDEALETKKFKRARENKIEFAYDYGNLNASYQTSSLKPYVSTVILEKIIIDLEDKVMSLLEKEKANLKTIDSLKSKGFESSENAISKSENQSEKECDQVENSKVIAPRIFKLSVSQSVSPISISKTSCDYKNVENKTKRKRHLDTFSSVRRPKHSGVILKQKHSSNTANVDLSSVSHLKLNKDVKRYSRKDLLSYTFSSVRRPKHSGVVWKKKGSSNTSNVDLSSVNHLKLNKDVKRYSHKDLLSCNNCHLRETSSAYDGNDAMNVSCNSRLCDSFDENNLFIFDDESVRISPVSKMPFRKKPRDSMNVRSKSNSNKSLPRIVHRWLPKMQKEDSSETSQVQNGFASNKPLYLLHMDLCRPMRVENKASEEIISFIKKTQVNLQLQVQRVRTDNGMVFKNKTLAKFFDEAEAIATACFTQNRSIIHDRFDKTPYELLNKRKPNIKFFHVFGCRCYLLNDYEDVGKLKEKGDIRVFVGYSKESTAFRIYNKRTRKIHESVNANFDEISEMASKQFSLEQGLSNLNKTRKSSNPSIMKSSTTNVETSNVEIYSNEEVFHESSESFQKESSSSSLNNDVRQGFVSKQYPDHMFALDKALYGLKQTPRAWYDVLSQFLIESGFQKESEYVAVSSCYAQVLWMRTQLTDYDFFYDKVQIYCDSKSAIAISCNLVQHTRTQHIDVRSIHVLKEKKVYASVHLSLKKKRSLL
uniref:Retroviral polymerase SH3-like domain-containing protein n=1 Tax=Tanacetum cinerariifolium TaxID=118510 RepID=A0A6L2KHR2_TANCI|nr:hypothetical protein [Tanacetum cinerariifolium]